MTEFRRDPITGRWVIIASGRAKRPDYFKKEQKHGEIVASCPFCPGNEEKTPKEIRVDIVEPKLPDGPYWQIRVVPNLYPAAEIIEGGLERPQKIGLYSTMKGYGAHEVIIESSRHNILFEDQPTDHLMLLLMRFKERVIDLYKDDQIKQVVLYKNHGREGGASIAHPHSQLVTLPFVPDELKEELNGARAYYAKEKSCVWCDILDQTWMNIVRHDRGTKQIIKSDPLEERLVSENRSFAVLCPFASKFPYEMHVIPKRHSHYFGNFGEKENFHEIKDLAEIFKVTIKKLNKALSGIYPDSVSYNFFLHTSPNLKFKWNDDKFKTLEFDFHWHFEIHPRTSIEAGFERGSGSYINVVAPEIAAKELREAPLEIQPSV
jgi:UDPglucose--hexose-1-phosphate uridylyltransferase